MCSSKINMIRTNNTWNIKNRAFNCNGRLCGFSHSRVNVKTLIMRPTLVAGLV